MKISVIVVLLVSIFVAVTFITFQRDTSVTTIQPPAVPQVTEAVTPSPGATVLSQVNALRTKENIAPLQNDTTLCSLAKTIADKTALSYPEEVSIPLQAEGFTTLIQNQITLNDALVELAKSEDQTITLPDEVIAQFITAETNPEQIALNPDITHACTAVSEQGIGVKPFAIFIGGSQK